MLTPIPSHMIDAAWREGASELAKACDVSGGEIEGPQLNLARGERTLFRMDADGKPVGWGVARIDQLPNVRVLFVTDLVAPNGHFETFFEDLQTVAKQFGCSEIRCAAKDAQARLYRMKCNFEPVYQILRVGVK
jgi:hypothetical protein